MTKLYPQTLECAPCLLWAMTHPELLSPYDLDGRRAAAFVVGGQSMCTSHAKEALCPGHQWNYNGDQCRICEADA